MQSREEGLVKSCTFPAGSRYKSYAEHLEGGLDGSVDSQDSDEYEHWRGRSREISREGSSYRGSRRDHRAAPSSTLHIRVIWNFSQQEIPGRILDVPPKENYPSLMCLCICIFVASQVCLSETWITYPSSTENISVRVHIEPAHLLKPHAIILQSTSATSSHR